MTDQEFEVLFRKARKKFKSIPGVSGVGYGLKEKDGVITDDVVWRIYVEEKKPLQSIPDNEVIAPEFEGIPTDVIILSEMISGGCVDTELHSTPFGGITIINPFATSLGTLGCMTSINGETGRDRYALLTNHHVLRGIPHVGRTGRPGGIVGDNVMSVKLSNGAAGGGTITESKKIAKVNNMGHVGVIPYTYSGPGQVQGNYFVDCASAKMNTCYSSWCNTNCGMNISAEVRDLGINNNFLRAPRRVTHANVGMTVHKVGRTTSKTTGRIVDPVAVLSAGEAATARATNLILIQPTGSNCLGFQNFFMPGDSGAVLVSDQGEVIGLMTAQAASNQVIGIACHIHPVLDRLGLTILTSNDHLGTPGSALTNAPGSILSADDNPHFQSLKSRFEEEQNGIELFSLVEEHRSEISTLINHCRPVTVVWHRSKGPTFLSFLLNSARDPEYLIPSEVEGITLKESLRNVGKVLAEHGSPALKQAIAENRDRMLAVAGKIKKVEEFFTLINSNPT